MDVTPPWAGTPAAFRAQLADDSPGPSISAVAAAAAPVAVTIDLTGAVLAAPPTAAALFAVPALVGQDLHGFVAEDERATLTAVIQHAVDDRSPGHALDVLLTGRRADGLPLALRVAAPAGIASDHAIALVLERWGGPVRWDGEAPEPGPPRAGPDHLLSHDARGAVRNTRNFAGIVQRRLRAAGPGGGPVVDATGAPVPLDMLDTALRSAGSADEMLERVVWYLRLQHEPLAMQPLALDRLVEAGQQEAARRLHDLGRATAPGDSTPSTDLPPLAPGLDALTAHLHRPSGTAPPEVVGNPELLSWALGELLVNARKFGGADSQITIESQPATDRVELWVTSTGRAIDPELAEDAFRLGRMLQPRGEQPGVGMGLPLVRRIATRHGGRAEVLVDPGPTTAEGGSTTVRLRLPAAPTGPGLVREAVR